MSAYYSPFDLRFFDVMWDVIFSFVVFGVSLLSKGKVFGADDEELFTERGVTPDDSEPASNMLVIISSSF